MDKPKGLSMIGFENQGYEVPLTELLRRIPKSYRASIPFQWSESGMETGHHLIPCGHLMHRAANEIERLTVKEGETFEDGVASAADKFRQMMVTYDGTTFQVLQVQLIQPTPAPANTADYKALYHACAVSYVKDIEEAQKLREDAERYQWFRSKRLWDADQFPWPKDFEYPDPCLWDAGEMLDAAIDAARKL